MDTNERKINNTSDADVKFSFSNQYKHVPVLYNFIVG